MSRVTVVGAGVIGLTTSLLLAQKGYDVTIVASHIPTDFQFGLKYTSPIAGADWHSFANHDEIEIQEFDKPAYRVFKRLANVVNSGVALRKSYTLITKGKFEADGGKVDIPWFKDFVTGFEMVPQDELGSDFEYGYRFDGFVISTTVYLSYLLQECYKLGVTLQRKTLTTLDEAYELHHSGERSQCIVNCSGLLAKYLVPDPDMIGIKGQTILVENNAPHELVVHYNDPEHPNELLYVMPRKEGGCVIGGYMKSGCEIEDESVDIEFLARIKGIAKRCFPILVDSNYRNNPDDLKVVRYQVGLRPGRKGGYRIEKDAVNNSTVHCYGHGGAGYQSSYGTCYKAIGLVDSVLSKSKL